LPLKLKIYIGIITALAIALFIYLIPSLPSFSNTWLAIIFFLTISTFAEFVPVHLPIGGVISIGFPIDFVVILVYGPVLAMLIAALSALIGEIIERKVSWYKIIFNSSQCALSAGIAGLVYQYSGGIVGFQNFFKFIFPAALCAFIYPIINLILVNVFISLEKGLRLLQFGELILKIYCPVT